MKTLTTKPKHRVERTALSDIIGLKEYGFYDDSAIKIVNLRPSDGAFKLRDGIVRGLTTLNNIGFSGSTNVGGMARSYVSDGIALYEVTEAIPGDTPSEAVFISDSAITENNTFLFTVNGKSGLYNSGTFYQYRSYEFLPAEFYEKTADLGTVALPVITDRMITDYLNILTGNITLKFTAGDDMQAVIFETAPEELLSARVNGEAVDASLSEDSVTFDFQILKGDTVTLRLRFKRTSPEEMSLIGCSEESDGAAFLYSERSLYKLTSESGKLFCAYPAVTFPEGGIKRVFFCSGVLCAAVGNSICTIDAESGSWRIIDSDGVPDKKSVCPCGGFAYISTGSRIARLTVSRSGYGEELKQVTMKDSFAERQNSTVISMAYSHIDRCLWTICKTLDRNIIYVLDTDSGVWFEVNGIDLPSECFECEDIIAIVSRNTIYFSIPGQESDIFNELAMPINGSITLCASDLGDPLKKKRILSCALKTSGPIGLSNVILTADNGRSDSFLYYFNSNSDTLNFPASRTNVGRFRYLTVSVSLFGPSSCAVHDLYLDVLRM